MVSLSRLNDIWISPSRPASAFLWPEIEPRQLLRKAAPNEVFVFQYFPETVDVGGGPTFSDKQTPGGSHPLYQWTGNAGRQISFSAVFTSELDPTDLVGARPMLSPSYPYTVDVQAAAAALESFKRPKYTRSVAGALNEAIDPPRRLYLVLPNLNLGGNRDEILVILDSADLSYEAFFPSGYPRVMSTSLTFNEVVQHMGGGSDAAQVSFIGREQFEAKASLYDYKGSVFAP